MIPKYIYILALLAQLFACTNKQAAVDSPANAIDTSTKKTDLIKVETDDGCVFDTSVYKFTSEAILKYNPKLKYLWHKASQSASVLLDNGDSLQLHIGGCNHFEYQATLLTNINFSNKSQLFDKTAWLAKTFFSHGFEAKVPELITNRQISILDVEKSEKKQSYSFNDADMTVTNLILDNFSFEQRGRKTVIEILVYME